MAVKTHLHSCSDVQHGLIRHSSTVHDMDVLHIQHSMYVLNNLDLLVRICCMKLTICSTPHVTYICVTLAYVANLPQYAANLPQYAANLPQYAANLPSGRMSPPHRAGHDPALLPATCPSSPAEGWGQQWGPRKISCISTNTTPARLPYTQG